MIKLIYEIKEVFNLEDSINNESSLSEDQIELAFILKFLKRNKFLIILFSVLGFLFGSYNLLTTKPSWEGEFQIVLEEEDRNLPLSINSALAELTGLGIASGEDSLKTEVGILKSPLVLNEVFEFIKKEKELKKDNSMKNLRFKNWKINQLDIGLEKGTSILNLAYRDTDKNIILPVLNLISKNYQEYSGRKRQRNLKLGLDFFKNQIKLYKAKNIESLRDAQEYAAKYDLSILIRDSDSDDEGDIKNKLNIEQINIEQVRINSANEIRNVEIKLEQIEKLNEPDELLYFSSLIPGFLEQNVPKQLKQIEFELSSKRVFMTDKDESIRKLIYKRDNLIKVLKKQAINQLNAIRMNELAKLKASERPKGVLINYIMLLNEYQKDNETLNKLEEENRILMLENARSQDPWELITTPTISPRPVSPVYTKVLLIYTILGLILGTTLSLIYERRRGFIFTTIELEKLFNPFLVWLIDSNDSENFDKSIRIFTRGPLSKSKGDISFMVNKNFNNSFLDNFKLSISKNIKNRKLNVINDLTDIEQSENFVFVTGLGLSNKNDVIKLRKIIEYQNFNFIYMLVVENTNIKNSQMLEIKKELFKISSKFLPYFNKFFK